jgi:ABC-2 type transport system ATP-binding protein
VIEITNVTKRFHSLIAVNSISLRIKEGEVLGVLGPNGAGKTTLFRLIAGFLNVDSGAINSTSNNWPAIGYKPERLLFPNSMRVREYLKMVASLSNLQGSRPDDVVDESLERVDLSYASGKRIRDCSKGMRQRLALAQAMIGNPALLLLDEPSNGLDPEGQSDICSHIEELHQAGKTIVLASHQLHEVTQVCTHLVILDKGKIHYENTMNEALAERPHVTIKVDSDTHPVAKLLESLHPSIHVAGEQIILENGAITLRRQILSILLSAGYDVSHVEHSRVTLAEIYAEAIQ